MVFFLSLVNHPLVKVVEFGVALVNVFSGLLWSVKKDLWNLEVAQESCLSCVHYSLEVTDNFVLEGEISEDFNR